MHEPIKNFFLEGEIPDHNIVESKARLVSFLESQMRDEGYVPNLDLEPQFTLTYLLQQETFAFKLTVYGTHIGEEKSWSTSGTTSGKMIPKYTANPKSTKSSNEPV